jgi:O-antigen/teichoic acid export membrane protein
MQITKKDVLWNYAATFLKIASSALLLPFILKMMPSQMVGIWSIFMTITAFASILDFGFNPSFSRNVTYVFSGVKSLKSSGHESVDSKSLIVDYGLLKGLIASMRWFYSRMSIIVFVLLTTLGTFYIHRVLKNYNGSISEIYISWGILCLINTYNLYTLYYDSLLEGKGLIKRAKQIIIIGQSVYLFIASILILKGFGLIAIISAQALSVIIVRFLSFRAFFSPAICLSLKTAISKPRSEILKAIYPNALKIGLSSLGGFMVTRSAILVGSLYLTLDEIASYGITIQLIGIITSLAGIYTATFIPKIVQLRVEHRLQVIKKLYLKGQLVLLFTFIIAGMGLLFIGPLALNLIGSKTELMPFNITALAIFVYLEETNLSIAASILLTKNEVPFFKASLISGGLIIVGLLIGFNFLNFGLIGMILIPLIIDLAYQAWKWPLEVAKDLGLTFSDITNSITKYLANDKVYNLQNKNT